MQKAQSNSKGHLGPISEESKGERRARQAEESNEKNAGADEPEDMIFDEADAARKPRVIRRPETRMKQEIADHLPLHLPYRSWCPECVAGRGVSSPHVTSTEEPLGVTISIDYCFMSQQDEESDNVLKAIWALPAQNKGAVPYVIEWLVGVLDTAGYRGENISLKSDQEPAIVGQEKGSGRITDGGDVPHRLAGARIKGQWGR